MKKISIALLLMLFHLGISAQELPEKPQPFSHVSDFASLLTSEEKKDLEDSLMTISSIDYRVAIVASIKGSSSEKFTTELWKKWNPGNEGDNSVLLLIAVDERDYYLLPSENLKEKLNSSTRSKLIENFLRPSFKKKNYKEGIHKTLTEATRVIQGTSQPQELGSSSNSFYFILILILGAFFLIAFPIYILRTVRRNHLSTKSTSFATGLALATGLVPTGMNFQTFVNSSTEEGKKPGGVAGSW